MYPTHGAWFNQNAKILTEVVNAGKDCNSEKPMSSDIEDAKLARKATLASSQVEQIGSQWLSDQKQMKVRDIVSFGR